MSRTIDKMIRERTRIEHAMTSATPKPRAGEHVPSLRLDPDFDRVHGYQHSVYGPRHADGGNYAPLLTVSDSDFARRIVAAVNACEGIPTELLSDGVHRTNGPKLTHLRERVTLLEGATRDLTAERDLLRERERALVEALDLACHWAKHNGFGEGMMAEAPWLDKARAAIAKHGR